MGKEKVIRDITALWYEIKQRRQIVLEEYEKSTHFIGRNALAVVANEQCNIMDSLLKILENVVEEDSSPVPGNAPGLTGRSVDGNVVG
jgi:hypothetical protein